MITLEFQMINHAILSQRLFLLLSYLPHKPVTNTFHQTKTTPVHLNTAPLQNRATNPPEKIIKVMVINKEKEIWALINQSDTDILIGTETWLSQTLAEVVKMGWKTYRKDYEE